MPHRITVALPLAFILGCAATPSAEPAQTPAPASADSPSTPAEAPAPKAPPSSPTDAKPPSPTDTKKADEAPPAGRAAPADAPISTKITQDEILSLVQKSSDLFNRCYTIGAGASKSFRAKVTIKATVSPVGTVSAAEVVNSTAKNPKVDACVSDAFKKLTFPRPKGSGATVFTFPMNFDGLEQVP